MKKSDLETICECLSKDDFKNDPLKCMVVMDYVLKKDQYSGKDIAEAVSFYPPTQPLSPYETYIFKQILAYMVNNCKDREIKIDINELDNFANAALDKIITIDENMGNEACSKSESCVCVFNYNSGKNIGKDSKGSIFIFKELDLKNLHESVLEKNKVYFLNPKVFMLDSELPQNCHRINSELFFQIYDPFKKIYYNFSIHPENKNIDFMEESLTKGFW
jgi:hypothetical protein